MERIARMTRALEASNHYSQGGCGGLSSPVGVLQDDLVELRRSMFRSILNGHAEKISVWLPNGVINVQSSAGSIIATAYSAQLVNCPGYADWLTVFSTYRLRAAMFTYTPYFKGTGTNTGQIAGGVRYGNNITAPASVAEVQQLDDSKMVALCDGASWRADFDSGYSDYIAASTPSTVYGNLLIYSVSTSGVGVSTNYGSLTGKCLVEFEGLV